MLSQVKEGDKIKFVADKINGAFTVVQIEVVR
jgi:Cu/Ag efflux protein CusF